MSTTNDFKKFLRIGVEETGPRVGVVLPKEVNKALINLQADYDYKDKPTKEELIIAAVRKGLNMPV